jgi:hypothetical protein
VEPRRPPPLPLFAAVSLGLHVAAAIATHRGGVVVSPTFQAGVEALTGDTLDVEPPVPADEPEMKAQDPATATKTSVRPTSPSSSSMAMSGTIRSATGGATSATVQVATFGAVGVRYATDLATTFTRAFPQAASADAAWGTASFGPAGTAEVTLVLDESGRVSSTSVGGNPSLALRRGIERTLALLTPRVFTASAPSTRLRVTARVARDEVHDGLHGDVFALSGGSFSGEVGTAFFALPSGTGPGRRVDVELRLLP